MRFTGAMLFAMIAFSSTAAAEQPQGAVRAGTTPNGRTFAYRELAESEFRNGGDLKVVASFSLGAASGGARVALAPQAADPYAFYSNVTTFGGAGFAPGGATLITGNTITKLVADDLTTTASPLDPTHIIATARFAISNVDAAVVTCRPRIRFWQSDGAGGLPGTVIAGYSFNAIAFPAGSVQLVVGALGVTGFAVTAGSTIWAGVTFDDNAGATGATAAQLNNMGMGIYAGVGAPEVGSSTDNVFLTTAAGSNFVANPAGTTWNLGGTPKADLGWELATPVELVRFAAD